MLGGRPSHERRCRRLGDKDERLIIGAFHENTVSTGRELVVADYLYLIARAHGAGPLILKLGCVGSFKES